MGRDNTFCKCIQEEYVFYRRDGKSRDETVRTMLDYYAQELEDGDDVVPVLTGITLALRKKRELFDEFAAKAKELIDQDDVDPHAKRNLERLLADPTVYGQEAFYRIKKPYDTGWKYGDTFAHTITCPGAKRLGIDGWTIIFYEYGAHLDKFHCVHHLMCVSVCPPDQIPCSSQQLNELGFLPMLHSSGPNGKEIQYHVSVSVQNKREEANMALTKIGRFPDVRLPQNLEKENLLVSRVFIGYVRKGTEWPCYEEEVCAAYQDYLRRGRCTN